MRDKIITDKPDRSPRIARFSWGSIEVESHEGVLKMKDAKLYPGGAVAWDWTETGTSHESGVKPADVEELLNHGADVVVISRGVLGRLRVAGETLRMLEERGIIVHVERTEEAVKLYNELRKTRAVGGLFHSTC